MPPSCSSSTPSTEANFGAMISRCRSMWSRTPCGEPKNCECRSWLTLSGPIAPLPRCPMYHLHGLDRAGQERHPGAGVGDLRRRGEHDRPVRVPGGRRQRQDVGALGLGLGQVVERVGVVPEDLEVRRRGGHRGQPLCDLLADDRAAGVGVGRDHPYPLDARVLRGQLGHRVRVRSVVVHRHRHHLDAEPLEQREVPVVAGDRADEPDRLLLRPTAARRPRRP